MRRGGDRGCNSSQGSIARLLDGYFWLTDAGNSLGRGKGRMIVTWMMGCIASLRTEAFPTKQQVACSRQRWMDYFERVSCQTLCLRKIVCYV